MARNLIETFDRLTMLLEAETAALRLGSMVDLSGNADSKARILLELSQWRTMGSEGGISKDQASALVALLNDNAIVLEQHMAAAKKVSNSLAQHLRDADSDGTYRANTKSNRGGYLS